MSPREHFNRAVEQATRTRQKAALWAGFSWIIGVALLVAYLAIVGAPGFLAALAGVVVLLGTLAWFVSFARHETVVSRFARRWRRTLAKAEVGAHDEIPFFRTRPSMIEELGMKGLQALPGGSLVRSATPSTVQEQATSVVWLDTDGVRSWDVLFDYNSIRAARVVGERIRPFVGKPASLRVDISGAEQSLVLKSLQLPQRFLEEFAVRCPVPVEGLRGLLEPRPRWPKRMIARLRGEGVA